MTAPVLDLAVGSGLVLDGAEWVVEQLEPQYGAVALTRADGKRMRVSVRFLVSRPQCRPSSRSAVTAADRGRQPKTLRDLSPHQRELAHLRLAHVLEACTGFRSGDPSRPGPGEPKPEYDPATTTLTRRLARQGRRTPGARCLRGQAPGPGPGQLPDPDQVGYRAAAVGRDGVRG